MKRNKKKSLFIGETYIKNRAKYVWPEIPHSLSSFYNVGDEFVLIDLLKKKHILKLTKIDKDGFFAKERNL